MSSISLLFQETKDESKKETYEKFQKEIEIYFEELEVQDKRGLVEQ